MDIALIIHELLVEGGGERQCVCLAQALAKHGHNVTLYTSAYDRPNCFPEICKSFPIKEVGRGPLPGLRKPLFLRGYLDMLRLATAVRGRHEIWNPHHWPAQWGAVWLKRRLGGAVVWMCNDVPDFRRKAQRPQSMRSMAKGLLYWFYYFYDRRQNRKVDLTLFLSNWAESEYRSCLSRVVRASCEAEPTLPVLRLVETVAEFVPGLVLRMMNLSCSGWASSCLTGGWRMQSQPSAISLRKALESACCWPGRIAAIPQYLSSLQDAGAWSNACRIL